MPVCSRACIDSATAVIEICRVVRLTSRMPSHRSSVGAGRDATCAETQRTSAARLRLRASLTEQTTVICLAQETVRWRREPRTVKQVCDRIVLGASVEFRGAAAKRRERGSPVARLRIGHPLRTRSHMGLPADFSDRWVLYPVRPTSKSNSIAGSLRSQCSSLHVMGRAVA